LNNSLVDCLIEILNTEGINYCHWKSNIDLDQAISGDMDLDFLVARESYLQMISILSRLGFKSATARWGENTPGIAHYYGYDLDSDRFAHIHLFSRVLTGESSIKSHLLPFHKMLLGDTRFEDNVRVPSKAAELVIFTIRTYVKYGSMLDLLYLVKKNEKVKSELAWLKDGGDLEKSIGLLKEFSPSIDEKLFVDCITTLETDGSLVRRIGLARKLRGQIRHFSKQTSFEKLLSFFRLIGTQLQRRIGSGSKNKIMQAGGSVIAIVGADASGKSTIVSETGGWLSKSLLVRIIHAGKPSTSLATAPINILLHLSRSFWPKRQQMVKANLSSSDHENSSTSTRGTASLLYAFRAVALAWDRKNLLLKSWRAAAKGEIIICDRYPSNNLGAMDSPRLKENLLDVGWQSPIINLTARLEQRIYRQIPPPDLVIRLQVSVETAKERNRLRIKPRGETDDYIEFRHKNAAEWNRSDAARVFDIDTGQPLSRTMQEIKTLIWRSL
jgi:thymidylate kinase